MEAYPDCIPCLLRQARNSLQLCGADEAVAFEIFKKILRCASGFERRQSPPEMAMHIHRIIRREIGDGDPYRRMKAQAIEEVLKHESRIRTMIDGSANPFRSAVRFALAGNVLDFAVLDWNPDRLSEHLDGALHKKIDETAMDRLEKALSGASSVMVLGDNAGESVFDWLLIEKMLPRKVVYAVRGAPAINDVTMDDALASGLADVATIMGNGSDAPGTLLEEVSDEFLNCFKNADLVIAKGQGNYESLCSCRRKIFFLTQIKCHVIARDLNGGLGDWIIKENGEDR